ncbi:GNAT family N-acetyltransferase [Caulobacter mirabilis]|uniref:GNAT family N-acetyltransferase n=1 Tax=Caulobacter mirabilis TaxID=69666 RepID=A0A2D2AV69_9CAUL|nr:GNAT family N-acetyltransferase [Caulobacter mirabilis]ATQ41875.1 GNAT family N-acetyltransferase [Caulobacter mirabilis]
MAVSLRPARAEEAPALSALCLRSKGHWGYDEVFLEACREELTLSLDELDSVVVAEDGVEVVGLAQVLFEDGDAVLEKLFVDPSAIGCGVGRRLFDWAVEVARSGAATRMVIDADPDAAPIYRAMGAIDAGGVPSASIPGRVLPRLVFVLREG